MTPEDDRELLTKRVLIGLSHAIESFALAAAPGDPLVVIALFQRMSYFEREAAVYRDIAARGAITVVGLVEDFPAGPPVGVRYRPIAEDDSLAREWSVVVLGPHGGAALVAVDQESVAADAATFELGREFLVHWSFRRRDAYREAERLCAQLRLPAALAAEVDGVLRAVAATPEPRRQSWYAAPLRSLAADMERAERGHDRARAELSGPNECDEVTGLPSRARLERWTAGLGRGTLPVGLVAVRLLDMVDLRARLGVRMEVGAVQAAAAALAELTGSGAERLVRLGRHDFLFVLPSARPARVSELRRAACAQVDRMQHGYPFVDLHIAVASTITRDRPLPVDVLLDELGQVRGGAVSMDSPARPEARSGEGESWRVPGP